jgi:glycosyltransferase involved in cell wall biosynthesis
MSQNMLPFEPLEAKLFGQYSLMRLKMLMLRYSQGRSFCGSNGVVFLTEYARDAISSSLSLTNKTAIIPHGIESRFRIPPRVPRCIADCSPDNPFRILYVSITMPYKHHCEVAEAVAQLRGQGYPIEMCFIGPDWGGYGKQLKQLLITLDPQGQFLKWSGAEPFEALHQAYSGSDAFVFASSCENLPNILIEAMSAGLPIACSSKGPMPEVLGPAGVYFEPDSVASIADSLRVLIDDSALRERLAKDAFDRASGYSWAQCAEDTFSFISSIYKDSVCDGS